MELALRQPLGFVGGGAPVKVPLGSQAARFSGEPSDALWPPVGQDRVLGLTLSNLRRALCDLLPYSGYIVLCLKSRYRLRSICLSGPIGEALHENPWLQFHIPLKVKRAISTELRTLLQDMLAVDPDQRPEAIQLEKQVRQAMAREKTSL